MNTRGVLIIGGNNIPVVLSKIETSINSVVNYELIGYEPFDFDKCDIIPRIDKVIFNDPATVVIWVDGVKTVVKCQDGDAYSKEIGLAMCIAKRALGNKGKFNEVFKRWIDDYDQKKPD